MSSSVCCPPLSYIRVQHKADGPWEPVTGSEGVAQHLLDQWRDAYPASAWEWVDGYVFDEVDEAAWHRLEDRLERVVEAPEFYALMREGVV